MVDKPIEDVARVSALDAHTQILPNEASRQFKYTDADFQLVRSLIRDRTGIALSNAKKEMVYGRLVRRVRATGATSVYAYLTRLRENLADSEWTFFVEVLTTNLTSFFREAHHFEMLETYARERGERANPLRVWSVAASTGEEPYSIAMSLWDISLGHSDIFTILASDVNQTVLTQAQAGVYAADKLKPVSDERRSRFFMHAAGPDTGALQVRPMLQQKITWQYNNLLDKHWPIEGVFDVIFCRNVLIYFDKEMQLATLERFHPLLREGGLLFLGHAEQARDLPQWFEPCGRTVYRRKG